MSRTQYLFDEPVVPRRAAGYQRGARGIENASFVSATYYHAAGGLGSTVLDLARWDRAMRSNQLVSAEGFDEMLRPARLNDGGEFPYGYGWGTAAYRGHRFYHHAGGVSGFACHMLHGRDDDVTIIVLSNLFQFPFDRVSRALTRSLLGKEIVRRRPISLPSPALDACAGTYSTEGFTRKLVPIADGLAFEEPGGPELIAIGEGHFREKHNPEVEYVFGALDQGVFTRLRYSTPLFPPTYYMRRDLDAPR
jgi:CubicO group peptidase (beta-lactamase class C family)